MIRLGYAIYTVADVDATLSFFTDAFGLERRFITPEGDYGELETGATTLAFVAEELAHANLDAAGGFTSLDPSTAPIASTCTLVTDDVHAAHAQAVAAGAITYVDPMEKPWGQTVAYVRDRNGILVELATPIGASAQ